MRKRHYVAVDIGGSKIALLARERPDGRDILGDRVATPRNSTVSEILSVIDKFVHGLDLAGIGIAVPGHVDERGLVLRAGNLRNWRNVPLKALAEERYDAPAFVEGDANCGALGEKWRGAAREMDDFVFLALGTGVGAGIVLDGKLHRGVHSAAGETGDLVIRGRLVGKVAGKRSIQRAAREATGKPMRSGDALRRAESDRRLEIATREVIESLATSVAALWSIVDPEAIILGGGTAKAGHALLRQIRKRVAPLRPRLLLTGLGSEAQLYGAMWGAANVTSRRPRRRSSRPASRA